MTTDVREVEAAPIGDPEVKKLLRELIARIEALEDGGGGGEVDWAAISEPEVSIQSADGVNIEAANGVNLLAGDDDLDIESAEADVNIEAGGDFYVNAGGGVGITATTGTASVTAFAGAVILNGLSLDITTFDGTAGAAAGTLTNAPVAGNPAKWINVVISGDTYRIPAWAIA
jgi:uncharacterized protein (DUF2345 family)